MSGIFTGEYDATVPAAEVTKFIFSLTKFNLFVIIDQFKTVYSSPKYYLVHTVILHTIKVNTYESIII